MKTRWSRINAFKRCLSRINDELYGLIGRVLLLSGGFSDRWGHTRWVTRWVIFRQRYNDRSCITMPAHRCETFAVERRRRPTDGAARQVPTSRRLRHLSMAVLTTAAAPQRLLPSLHQMDWQRTRCLQAGWLQGRLASLGTAQEQARYELRDDGTCTQVTRLKHCQIESHSRSNMLTMWFYR